MADSVLALAQLAFAPALWPSVRGPDKPAATTSVLHVVIIATTQASLGLWRTAATSTLLAVLWAILAMQMLRADRRARAGR